MRLLRLLGLTGLLAVSAVMADDATQTGRELFLGSVAMDIPAAMHQRLKPLADYLGRELGRPVRLRLSPDFTRAVSEVATGGVDVAYLAPVAYLRAREAGNVRVIAKLVTRGRSTFRLMLVAREGSPFRTPQDLIGRSFALGDESAYLQRAVLLHAGLRLEQFKSYKFLGHYDNIARGVANGDFDAGILKDTTAYQWEKRGLRIIHASPELPPYNIAVSGRVDEALARDIQAALLRLNPANPEHARVVRALDESYDGFVAATDADYDFIRAMVQPFLK
jgi:phosphonate transport system substrate-binding protein